MIIAQIDFFKVSNYSNIRHIVMQMYSQHIHVFKPLELFILELFTHSSKTN